jgi:hypothetical protein
LKEGVLFTGQGKGGRALPAIEGINNKQAAISLQKQNMQLVGYYTARDAK